MTWNLGDQMRARLGKGSNIRLAPPAADKQEGSDHHAGSS
jgi:hypothetical protein